MEANTSNLDAILRKVQALIAQADHPNTDPTEAATFRAKAEALMFKYRIDEIAIAQQGPQAQALAPEWRTFTLCNAYSEFASHYRAIWSTVLSHVGIRGVTRTVWRDVADGTATQEVEAEAVGYESDLRYAELLFTAAALEFGKRLEPKYDSTLSEQVNAYLMRKAGMEGRRIAMAIYGRDDKALRPKVRKMFADEAALRGEDPKPLLGKGVNVKLYRKSYADGFDQEFWSRLNRMRSARGADEHGLVLASRNDAINEAFYTKYPQFRPMDPARGLPGQPGQKDCAKCAKAKSGYCRDHAWLRPRKSDGIRINQAGWDAGKAAAASVDIGGTTGRLETPRKEIG